MYGGYDNFNDYSSDPSSSTSTKCSRLPLGKQLNNAIKGGDVAQVSALLEKNVAIRQSDLNAAVLGKHTKILRILLKDGHYYDKSEIDLNPLLRSATTDGSDKIVDVLLQHGANPNTRNRNHVAVLTIALKKRFFRIADLLYHNCHRLTGGARIKDCPITLVVQWLYYKIENNGVPHEALVISLMENSRLDLNKYRSDSISFLCFALQKNNVRMVCALLEKGAQLGKSALEEKQQLLCIAAKHGYDNTVSTLLNNPVVDINCVNKNGETPLELALSNKQTSTVTYLLNHNATVTEAHVKVAIFANEIESLKQLLRHSKLSAINMDLFCEALDCKTTPIIIQFLLMQALIKDLNVSDSKGKTPLSITLKQWNVELTQLLLSKGASLEKNGGVNACLCDSVEALDIPITTLLLEHLTASIDSVQREGASLLHIALRASSNRYGYYSTDNRKKDMVEFLLSKEIDPDSYSKEGEPALHYSINKGEKVLIDLLVKAKANINKPHLTNKKTPLHIAAEKNDYETARKLLETRAFPDSKDLEGNTPLLCTLCNVLLSTKMVDLLIAHHANVNIANLKSQTPLSIALQNNRCILLIKLLKCGANSKSVGGYQKLILYAVKNRSQELFSFLKINGANVNQLLDKNKNALWLGVESGDVAFCEFLLQSGCELSIGIHEKTLRSYLEQAVANKFYYLVNFCLKKGVILDVDEAINLFSNLVIHNQPKALRTLLERGFILTNIVYQEQHGSLDASFSLTKNETKDNQDYHHSRRYMSSSSSYELNKIKKSPVIFAAEKRLTKILKLLIRYELRPQWKIQNIAFAEKKQHYYSNDYPHSIYQNKLREKKQTRPTYNPYANQHSYDPSYEGYHYMMSRNDSSRFSSHSNSKISPEIRSLIDDTAEIVKKELDKEKTLIQLKHIASVFFQGARQPVTGIPHLPGEIITHILLPLAIEMNTSLLNADVCKMVNAATPIESNTYKRYAGLFKSCQEIDVRELFDANGKLLHSCVVDFKVGTKIRVCIDGKSQLFELTAAHFSSSTGWSNLRLEQTLANLYQLATKGIYDSRPGMIFNDAAELASST